MSYSATESDTFTWTVSGNTVKMTGSSGSTTMKWSVSGNTLTLTNDQGQSQTLKRSKKLSPPKGGESVP